VSPLDLLNPITLPMGLFMLAMSHLGDADARYSAGCWGELEWYRCYQETSGDIHTPAYMHAIRVGHNPVGSRRVHKSYVVRWVDTHLNR